MRPLAWAAQAGYDVLLADAAVFPRDKTCGDGLTPRAIGELQKLGLDSRLIPFGNAQFAAELLTLSFEQIDLELHRAFVFENPGKR